MKKFLLIIICAAGVSFWFLGVDYKQADRPDSLQNSHGKDNLGAPTENHSIVIKPETIKGRKQSSGKYSWRYGYDIQLKNQSVIITSSINLVPSAGIKIPRLNQIKSIWEQGIEMMWSNKFAVTTPSGKQYPILVDAVFRGPKYHHDIIVRPGSGGTDQLNWNMTDSPAVAAHEFGHMLGIYDEYKGGALSPETGMIDSTSIMTSNPTDGLTYARHYKDFLDWFSTRTNIKQVTLTAIDPKNVSTTSESKEDKI